MRYLIVFGALFLLAVKALSLGDNSLLPAEPRSMTNTVRTLNQVTQETDGRPTLDQQDLQEKQFQEDRLREQKEWNKQKKIEDAELDEINTPK